MVLWVSVVGCPDIVPRDDSWVRRYGDTAIVRCNQTGETFYVTCLDTEWKGELAACSRGLTSSSLSTGLFVFLLFSVFFSRFCFRSIFLFLFHFFSFLIPHLFKRFISYRFSPFRPITFLLQSREFFVAVFLTSSFRNLGLFD